jgi:hypothetical protein
MVFSCNSSDIVRFINKEGVELFQIGKDKTGSSTYDTVYIKDNSSVAVSWGGWGSKKCITIIDKENTILPAGSKEHPVISVPFVFIFCFRLSCIFSTDMGGDSSATIICACLSFLRTKTISQGFDSTTTSANF